MLKLLKFVLVLMVLPGWCAAVQPYTPMEADPMLEPWRWQQEEALDGLEVLCMDEAEDGTLWFGCVGGVAHYDGLNVTRLPFDAELLSKITYWEATPWAKAMVILRNGNPLVLAGESLILRSGNEWKVIIQDVGISGLAPPLTQADDGTIWLLVPDGLWRISEDLSDVSMAMKASDGNSLKSFCFDRLGDFWVLKTTKEHGFRLLNIPVEDGRLVAESDWRQVPIPFKSSGGADAQIICDSEGLIWFADSTLDSGLEAFDRKLGLWIEREGNYGLHSLLNGRDGSLWGGSEGGILRWQREGDQVFYRSEQLQLPPVPLSLYEASNGRLWVIGRIGYVYSVDLSHKEWMTYAGLNFQCETPDGKQWFLSNRQSSVAVHDPRTGEWLQYGAEDNMMDSPVLLMDSSHGLVWAAGVHEGRSAIAVFDGTRWSRYCHPEFAELIGPDAAFESADGTVWFGAGGMLLQGVWGAGGALQYAVDGDGDVRLVKHHARLCCLIM